MFTAALFTTANRWKQTRLPSTDKWINKMEYFLVFKKGKFSHLLQHG
jgi:hypothetical protein